MTDCSTSLEDAILENMPETSGQTQNETKASLSPRGRYPIYDAKVLFSAGKLHRNGGSHDR